MSVVEWNGFGAGLGDILREYTIARSLHPNDIIKLNVVGDRSDSIKDNYSEHNSLDKILQSCGETNYILNYVQKPVPMTSNVLINSIKDIYKPLEISIPDIDTYRKKYIVIMLGYSRRLHNNPSIYRENLDTPRYFHTNLDTQIKEYAASKGYDTVIIDNSISMEKALLLMSKSEANYVVDSFTGIVCGLLPPHIKRKTKVVYAVPRESINFAGYVERSIPFYEMNNVQLEFNVNGIEGFKRLIDSIGKKIRCVAWGSGFGDILREYAIARNVYPDHEIEVEVEWSDRLAYLKQFTKSITEVAELCDDHKLTVLQVPVRKITVDFKPEQLKEKYRSLTINTHNIRCDRELPNKYVVIHLDYSSRKRPHTDGINRDSLNLPRHYDLSIDEQLEKLLKSKGYDVVWLSEDMTPNELIHIISNASAFIGVDTYMSILASFVPDTSKIKVVYNYNMNEMKNPIYSKSIPFYKNSGVELIYGVKSLKDFENIIEDLK